MMPDSAAGGERLVLAPRRWRLARIAAARLMDVSGALSLWDRVANRSLPRIVYYHNVHGPNDDVSWCREPSLSLSIELFRQHVESLRSRFTIVGLEDVAASPAPDRLALTFDDGYRGVYDHAFPLLRSWGIAATVFLVTGHLGSGQLLWWDRLLIGVERLRALSASAQEAGLRPITPPWRELLARAPLERLLDAYKASTGAERTVVDDLLAAVVNAPRTARDRIFLSTGEIDELRRAGWTFGAHTVSHPLLPWLDEQCLQEELVGSRNAVLSLTGQRGCWFSYPDGTFGDREEAAVVQAGFEGAVQTGRRPARCGRFVLPRVGISPWVIASPDGEYSAWRSRWALGRLTRKRLVGMFMRPRNA